MQATLGDWSIGFRPDMGGVVTQLRFDGVDILRPLESRHVASALDASAFVMAPYAGRIRDAAFVHEGRAFSLEQNFPPEPHSIHGVGWTSAWQAPPPEPNAVRLIQEHRCGDWPWAFDAQQTFRASDNMLSVELELTSMADGPAPAGLGWHPYFPDPAGAVVSAPTNEIWIRDAAGIAVHPAPPEEHETLREPKPVKDLSLDDCFSLGPGAVEIKWPDRGVVVKMELSPSLGHLVVYTPQGEPYFCVEPVSHVPDAINSSLPAEQTGLRRLAPGDTLEARIDLVVRRA